MSQTPDAVAREWFDLVWNNLDESAIDRLMHPEAMAHGLGAQPLRGPAGFKPFFHTFKSAFSNIRIHIDRGNKFIRFCDGKIIEGWNSFDFLTMFQLMGWVSNPVAPAS